VHLTTSTTEAPATIAPAPQVVRCACAVCGAHTNAMKTFRITGSCPNCGSFDLQQVQGAAPVGGPIAA
jgi:Zn finger protein HypA/HybF involved in hydrogenase expression